MDYERCYSSIIERAKFRDLAGYVERHHVVPRCCGGSDEADNIVRLTAEEHYVAHQLLVKMQPDNYKLIWALSAMTNMTGPQKRSGNKRYGWVRRRFAAMMSERGKLRTHSPETRALMSANRTGKKRKPHSEETKAKMSAAAKGRTKSPEHRAALSKAKAGRTRKPHSEDTKRRMSISNKQASLTRDQPHLRDPAYRARQAARMREIWAERRSRKQEG